MTSEDSRKNLMSINSHCAGVKFIGEDCLQFLNNLLISDLTVLPLNSFHYSALCNPKGRVITSLWIKIISSHEIKLITPKDMQANLLQFFNLRKFRQKIDISASDEPIYMSENAIVSNSDAQDNSIKSDTARFYHFYLRNNLPWISNTNTEKFIPQHINLDQHENIMSFSKGCYPGQEIVARIKYLGKIKKRMTRLKFTSEKELIDTCKKLEQVSPMIKVDEGNYQIQVIRPVP